MPAALVLVRPGIGTHLPFASCKHDPRFLEAGPMSFGREERLARWTGLEPATPGVTGRYSNQLSYHRALEGQIVGHAGAVKRETSAEFLQRLPAVSAIPNAA
jgi:hypothetical protein